MAGTHGDADDRRLADRMNHSHIFSTSFMGDEIEGRIVNHDPLVGREVLVHREPLVGCQPMDLTVDISGGSEFIYQVMDGVLQ
jgi:hypothetical protein